MSFALPEVTIAHTNFSVTLPKMNIADGEIVGFFGKSGAGKTSYMKRVREMFPPEHVQYMSQFDSLLEGITIRQNIELGLAAMGMKRADAWEWEQQHAELLHGFEVQKHLHKYPHALSGGQRKRAEIVRCFIMNPSVLLLDEPFNGIGHLFEAICTRELLMRRKAGARMTLVVSHDFDLLSTFCDRILLLDDQGVIGFVPVHERGWQPQDVRTAWTLAMENVLPATNVQLLPSIDLPRVRSDQWLGFWARNAQWTNTKKGSCICIEKPWIAATRSAIQKGERYTFADVQIPGVEQPLLLVGRGMIPDDLQIILSIEEVLALDQ